jgi:hypothetical protein
MLHVKHFGKIDARGNRTFGAGGALRSWEHHGSAANLNKAGNPEDVCIGRMSDVTAGIP